MSSQNTILNSYIRKFYDNSSADLNVVTLPHQTQGTVSELKEKRSLFDTNYRRLNIKSDTVGQDVKLLRTGVSKSMREIDEVVNELSSNVLNEERELRDVEKQTARGMHLVGKFETEIGERLELVKKIDS